ncbi:modular polyketide synthase [Streptomyces himastatinicus ATCC 53653]|uniref:Modular polyketide synthase n=1 Tax=Streptomyces himastatinicus ATCC 53653 TaxID=457427 RepID=D9WS68_9ACTN|nr:modular polyketide synthase [Streptomyces himastatinicus ATCC 53653]
MRFRLLTQALHDAGFRAFVQMGTGQLASLIGDTLQGRDHVVVAANSPHRDGVTQLRRVATALWTEGAPVDPALPRPGAARRSAPVRLNLDGALVSLGGARLAELRGVLAAGLSPTPPLPETGVLRPPAPQPTPAAGPLYTAVAPDASNVAPPHGATAGPHHPAPLSPPGADEAAASHPAVAGSPYAASPHVATAAGDYVPAAGSAHAAMAGTHHLVPPSPPGTGQPTAVAGFAECRVAACGDCGPRTTWPRGQRPCCAPAWGDGRARTTPRRCRRRARLRPRWCNRAVAGSQYTVPPNAATAGADYVAVAGTHPAAVAGPHHLVPPSPPGADNVGAAGSRPAAVPQAPASPYPAAGAAPAASPHVAAVGTGQAAPLLPTAPDAASARPVAGAAHPAPWAAELDALLRETADAAAELVAAGRARPVVARVRTYDVRVSSEAMPYLRDHCFFPQRPGWPDEADRWPVVPATTIVQHLIDAAEHTADGRHVAVAVHGARFDQWVTATPPSTVPVTVTPSATDPAHYTVTFGRSARGVVQLAPRYPDAADRPAPWRIDPATERIPEHTAAQIYDERWMFHGPAFQGLTRLTAIGEMQVRGTITTPAAPGALLDNVGQLLGYWIMATRTERSVVFPVGMRLMRFYGPPPRPGTEVECLVRVVALTDAALEADVQLLIGGEVWAELHGWHDRRFDNDPQTRPVERFPQRNTLSQPQPGGWSLVYERWPDLASRDLIMRNHLGGAERAEYARQSPLGRRQWLLGRIAAKDAVRRWLWEQGEGPVFPAEIRVCEDEHGHPYAVGVHGRTLPPLDLTLAHRAEAGVALVAPRHPGEQRRPGIGIGIEEVTERDVAFDPAERALLTTVTASGGASATWWAAAFRAAKEAVAKADGTGRDTAVVGAERTHLTVEAATAPGHPPRRYRVRCTTTANPSGLPGREYAVAWTTGPGHRDQDEETDQ